MIKRLATHLHEDIEIEILRDANRASFQSKVLGVQITRATFTPIFQMIQKPANIFRRARDQNIRVQSKSRIAVQNDSKPADDGEINSAARETGQQLFELGRRPTRFV